MFRYCIAIVGGIILATFAFVNRASAQGFAPAGPGFVGPAGPAAPGGNGQGPGGANDVQPNPSVNASSDARTNNLIVSAPPELLEQILKVVAEIDANPTENNIVMVYKLKNASALNVEAVANLLFNGTGGNNRGASSFQQLGTNRLNSGGSGLTGGGGRGGGGATLGGAGGGGGATAGTAVAATGAAGAGVSAGTANAASALAGQVSIVADPNTNSLLVSTDPKNWEQVRMVLDALDRSVPQVLIKVLVAEVTHDNTTDIGADLEFFNIRLDSSGSLTEGTRVGSVFGTPGFDNGGRGGIFQIAESQFSATIRALQATGRVTVYAAFC